MRPLFILGMALPQLSVKKEGAIRFSRDCPLYYFPTAFAIIYVK